MIRISDALAFRRRAGFWLVTSLAILLALISWINRYIVRFFNLYLFHAEIQGSLDPPGWWVYLIEGSAYPSTGLVSLPLSGAFA